MEVLLCFIQVEVMYLVPVHLCLRSLLFQHHRPSEWDQWNEEEDKFWCDN